MTSDLPTFDTVGRLEAAVCLHHFLVRNASEKLQTVNILRVVAQQDTTAPQTSEGQRAGGDFKAYDVRTGRATA